MRMQWHDKRAQIMQEILPTLAVAALGLVGAKLGDRFRIPFTARNLCDDPRSSGVVWSYKADAAQQQSAWRQVARHGTC